ncbi:PD-(D/E)XK motif protein [Dietzia sp. 111N12-1]|uniref:PD-(D/E)XK motif protein n=1 Tax=Dietzia sp. 111N12-1 TaxID=1785156 RepID=UPI000AF6F03B|nr:PD-(D/E)XK motif protein [Dietzia sp. 111N12-1]
MEIRDDVRRLTLQTVDHLWASGAPIQLAISGQPECWLRLEPAHSKLTLVTPFQVPAPKIKHLRNVSYAISAENGDEHSEIAVAADNDIFGAYSFLATIADNLQTEGYPLADAVNGAITAHRHVLEAQPSLGTERQIGLFGELLMLRHLIKKVGPALALDSWQGPIGEEHDFVFPSADFEVKTTVRETRSHVIAGLAQLQPTTNKPLVLVSIQLTGGSSQTGTSLDALVGTVRSETRGYQHLLDDLLRSAGWHPDGTYAPTLTLRTTPRAYVIDEDFPALTPRVVANHCSRPDLISEVSYRIDVTNLPHSSPRHPIDGFVEE